MANKEAVVTYGRRKRRSPSSDAGNGELALQLRKDHSSPLSLNNTRREKYKQYFLDFGQLDFTYSTCKICGLLYARGHGNDEKLHSVFHKQYLCGISFKGWQKERLVLKSEDGDERIILVLHSDPVQHQVKVKELVKIMEKELGIESGWLLHDRCKVYLYVSLKKVVGCAVTESISKAYPVLPAKASMPTTKPGDVEGKFDVLESCHSCREEPFPESKQENVCESDRGARTLLFGDVKFQRETRERCRIKETSASSEWPTVCTKLPVAAVCGVRGLWVRRSERRRGIATKLMDSIRASFIYGLVLDASQCAFSQPTPDGKAFAAKYSRTDQYLVYC